MFRTAAMIGAAIAVIGIPASSSAEPRVSGAMEFSAQQQQQKKKVAPVKRPQNVKRSGGGSSGGQQMKKVGPSTVTQPVRRVGPPAGTQQLRRVSPPTGTQQLRRVSPPTGTQQLRRVGPPTGTQQLRRVGPPAGSQQIKKLGTPGKPVGGQQIKKLGTPSGPIGTQQIQKFGGAPAQKKFTPIKPGPGQVLPVKPGSFPVVKLGNKVAPVWKSGPKKIWWHGGWKTFVPLTVLGAVVIGGSYYYADSYLTLARPYCEGFTPDGCRLNWQLIDFEDGGSEWQCLQYCPRVGAPPPARAVALVAPPPVPQRGCEISIFSEPDFGGVNATASDEQPFLSELGWQNQVASVKVISGTWDFFSEQEFTGETMRLQPGDYPDLGPQWTKHSGSFMCVQP